MQLMWRKSFNLIFFLFGAFFGMSPGAYAEDYRIGEGDLIEIRIWGEEKLSGDFRVSKSGAITHPLISEFKVKGSTAQEVEAQLTESLGKDYLRQPKIQVVVKEYRSQKVYLLGAVKRAGIYYLKGPTYFLDLIMDAGGPSSGHAGRAYLIEAEKMKSEFDVAQLGGEMTTPVETGPHQELDLNALLQKGEASENPVVRAGALIYVVPGGGHGRKEIYLYLRRGG